MGTRLGRPGVRTRYLFGLDKLTKPCWFLFLKIKESQCVTRAALCNDIFRMAGMTNGLGNCSYLLFLITSSFKGYSMKKIWAAEKTEIPRGALETILLTTVTVSLSAHRSPTLSPHPTHLHNSERKRETHRAKQTKPFSQKRSLQTAHLYHGSQPCSVIRFLPVQENGFLSGSNRLSYPCEFKFQFLTIFFL